MENFTYFRVSLGFIRYTGCFFYRLLELDSIIAFKAYTAGTSSDICHSQGNSKRDYICVIVFGTVAYMFPQLIERKQSKKSHKERHQVLC